MQSIEVKHFFDPATSTLTYVVCDPKSRDAVIVDPVLDYHVEPSGDVLNGQISNESFDIVADYIRQLDLKVHYILETHAHADHLSAGSLAKKYFPNALLGISDRICEVQMTFARQWEIPAVDGSQFDRLFFAGEEVEAGTLKFKVMPLPGHTPACVGYLFEPENESGAIFVGDAIFMPDFGTGRCDFPGGSAERLYASIAEGLYRLPDSTRIYVGHDYQPGGRELRFMTTVAEERASNIHVKDSTTKDEFVKFRTERDRTLKEPRLMIPSLKFNLVAGQTGR